MLRYRGCFGQSQPKKPNSIRVVETQRVGDAVDENRLEVPIALTRFEGCIPPFGHADELGYIFSPKTRNTTTSALEPDFFWTQASATRGQERPHISMNFEMCALDLNPNDPSDSRLRLTYFYPQIAGDKLRRRTCELGC